MFDKRTEACFKQGGASCSSLWNRIKKKTTTSPYTASWCCQNRFDSTNNTNVKETAMINEL